MCGCNNRAVSVNNATMILENYMSERSRKIIDFVATITLTVLLLWGFWSFFKGQAVFDLFSNNTVEFQQYLVGFNGGWAAVIFCGLIILEVLIAFIPSWFIYPIGVAIFGVWNMILLVMLGNFIGSSIGFWIGHKFGSRLLDRFVEEKYVTKFNDFMVQRGAWSVFFLKVNPITSFDLWNYIAGASPLGFWKFTFANLAGLMPITILAALVSEETYTIAPKVLGILLILTFIYIAWFFVNLPSKIKNRRNRMT